MGMLAFPVGYLSNGGMNSFLRSELYIFSFNLDTTNSKLSK